MCLSVLLVATAGVASGRAAAADVSSATSLGWVRMPGAEHCIDGRSLSLAVERRLGRVAVAPPSSAVRSIEGHIAPGIDGAGFRASFSLTGDTGVVLGTREIANAAADCRAMDDDLALVIALMIDPDSALAPAPPPSPRASASTMPVAQPLAASTMPVAPPPVAPPPVAPPPVAPPRFRFALRGGPAFSFGLLPSAAAGVAMHFTVVPPGGFPLELGGVLWAPQRTSSPGGDFGADLWMAYGALAACPLAGDARGFSWAACVGLHAGAAHVGGFGFEAALARDIALASLALGGHVRRTFAGPVFGALGLGLSIPFVRLDVYYRTGGERREVFSAPPLAGTLDLALGVELR